MYSEMLMLAVVRSTEGNHSVCLGMQSHKGGMKRGASGIQDKPLERGSVTGCQCKILTEKEQ